MDRFQFPGGDEVEAGARRGWMGGWVGSLWEGESVECAKVDHVLHGIKADLAVLDGPEANAIA